MREYRSLTLEGLPQAFDAEVRGEEPIVSVDESATSITITYTFPGFYVSDDSRDVDGDERPFEQLSIAATGRFGASGKPQLPSFGRYVQIPPNCDYSLSVETGQPVTFDNVLVLPAQQNLTDSADEEPKFEFDQDFYGRDQLYPEEMVRVQGPWLLDGYTALLLHVIPMQYNPATKTLLGYGNITVTLDLVPKAEADAEVTSSMFISTEAYGNLFVNPGRGLADRFDLDRVPVVPILPFFWGPEFLIIYHDTFEKPAQRLAHWKRMRGMRVETVSIATIGNTVANIKAYIRGKRGKFLSRLRYVLLFGDVDQIATETIAGGPWGSNSSDYYYSTPNDPSDTELVMPWLAIGRIPVRTEAQGDGVVKQIIDYEKSPPTDPDYYKRMVFAAYFQDNNRDGKADRGYVQAMESIRPHMVGLGFAVERIYVKTTGAPNPAFYYDGSAVPADVAAAMIDPATATNRLINRTTNGQLVTGHRDHGDTDGWVHPAFTNAHLASVTGSMPTVFFSVNCLTGQWDLAAPTESFGEMMLRMERGSPSLIAATRVSHTWLNNDLIRALFDGSWGGVLPTFPGGSTSYPVRHNRLGDLLNYAKAYLPVAMSGSNDYIKDHFEIYHCVGDPTLGVWRSAPRRVTLKAWVVGLYLHIQLYRTIADSVVTVWQGDKMLRRLEPASTNLSIKLPTGTESKRITVCYWAPGYRFRETVARRALSEDCISFDHTKAEAKNIGGRWKIVVGNMWMLDFGGSEAEARHALRIIQYYKMNRQCFVGRPDPSMEYYLVDGKAPTGSMPGEDCIGFNPDKIQVKQINGRWKIVEGSHWIMDFASSESEARLAYEIIKKYRFRYICFVGRPDPSMTYLKA